MATPADRPGARLRRLRSSWREWWHAHVADTVDQASVIATRQEDSSLTARYLFMLAMSAAIAILGLLLSSPAVVIGAMLLSPLMGPIIGVGFALATGDYAWLRRAALTLSVGTALGVALCSLVVTFSPLQTVTSEIAARTRPNLFDLLVALFSALAGAYAMIRGREGTIVGVAIATALMPPLAVIGFGLATLNWTVFSGAGVLFFTNLMAIALTAAVVARFYGFSSALSPHHSRLQTLLIALAFVALAVPLAVSLRTIAWEANASRQVNTALGAVFPARARVSQVNVDYDSKPIAIIATVLTPKLVAGANGAAERAIRRAIGRPVDVRLTQYQVGTSETAAEHAELVAARAREDSETQDAQRLAQELALAAGRSVDDVIVDTAHRRAAVHAASLPGATLETYRELEQRVARSEPDWDIEISPPPSGLLSSVEMAHGQPTSDGEAMLDLATWAALRLHLPIAVEGSPEVARRLEQNGVVTRMVGPARDPVRLRWDIPAP